MRRGLTVVVLAFLAGSMTPSAFGQYPYPYAPAYPPMPMPMPGPYMMPASAPMSPPPTVYVYGPLTPIEAPAPRPTKTTAARASALTKDGTPAPASPSVEQTSFRKNAHHAPLDACGPFGCGDYGVYGPHDPLCGDPPQRGHGHFIGDVGAYFLVPFLGSRLAFTSVQGTAAGDAHFPHNVDFGPRLSLGYLAHSGWGIRTNYWHLQGSVGQSITNTDVNTGILTPTAPPFQIATPSLTLQQGIGADQLAFRQSLRIDVADIEFLKECQWMDTTFVGSFGARYARIIQSYSATRDNPGGANGATIVGLDHQALDMASRFESWGPTLGLDMVHRLGKSNLSAYSDLRGSWLWGINRFTQQVSAQRASVDAGAPTFSDTFGNSVASDSRFAFIGEIEIGVQYGVQCGRCYVYGRAGGVFQRWWDVGSPSGPDGSVSLIGGTLRVGVTY